MRFYFFANSRNLILGLSKDEVDSADTDRSAP